MSLADESEEYRAFVEKFKPKKTTDDCYTPPEIFEVVLAYVCDRYGLDPERNMRPFYPGGDYAAEQYPPGAFVCDNPPFSILSEIVAHYCEIGVPFFLFCPTLTAFASKSVLMKTNHIICNTSITYENGAVVNTSFITNMGDGETVAESEPELSRLINEKDAELQAAQKKTVPKYEYPDAVITAAKINWFAKHGTRYKIKASECCPISCLDSMRAKGKSGIFGGGVATQRACRR